MLCLPFRARLIALISCLALLFFSAFPCLADSFSWDANGQGQFITSLCRDTHGNVWIGTEDKGVYRLDPTAPKSTQYTHFTTKDGLGDDNAYALACDQAGRVWVGALNHGVSVFNGKTWKTYGPLDGPLGSRVFALAVSPKDGGVWGATEAGLFRYQNSHWSYFTRAEGLPSDQANALAFDSDGTLYVGTQCDGIAIASPTDGYKSWRVVPGPRQMPNAATGSGLLSALINCLLVSANGTVYAGTPLGLADSKDEGLTWHYRRGVDWKAKLAGLYHPIVPDERPISGDLLHDDYVTCLGEDGAGRLFIGHRQGGVEVFDPKLGKRVQSGANGGRLEDYIGALLVQDYAVWVGMYGGGLLPPAHPEAKSASSSPAPSIPALPVPAAPPTLAQLNTMLTRVKSLTGQMPVGSGAYLGEDWQTQGDWVGRYGSRYAVLCAAAAPLDEYVLSDPSYTVTGFSGPHHREGDGLRSWCHWVHTNDSRVLWNPIAGYRRETEWDDHAEDYPQSFAGPDVWAKVSVPAGLHRLSLYLMNKDGHDGDNRYRDYLVELKHLPSNPDKGKDAPAVDPDTLPILTAARVHDFWFGVYERFLVSGPADYFVKVGKNGSFNTILQTVMLDKVSGPPTDYETRRSIWYGADLYQPPVAPHLSDTSPVVNAAQRVWEELDQNSSKQAASNLSTSFRILAYRALLASPRKSDDANTHSLAESWRWQLCLWNKADRETFQQAMAANREPLLAANPKLALGNQ